MAKKKVVPAMIDESVLMKNINQKQKIQEMNNFLCTPCPNMIIDLDNEENNVKKENN